MSYHQYPKRDAIKNYFPLPNEIFSLGLSTGALATYAYLSSLENRETYQCWPSYSKIANAIHRDKRTVPKYITELVDKGLISTENTSVIMRNGIKKNGNLMYTIRPIQEAIDYNYAQQMKQLDLDLQRQRAERNDPCFAS